MAYWKKLVEQLQMNGVYMMRDRVLHCEVFCCVRGEKRFSAHYREGTLTTSDVSQALALSTRSGTVSIMWT